MANNLDEDVNVEPLATVVWQDRTTSPPTGLLQVGYTAVDPNGLRTAPIGSLLSGPAGTWQNTNGITAWSLLGSSSPGSSMNVLTGNGAKGTVVTAGGGGGDNLAYNDGLNDYVELTLSAGDTFQPSVPFTPIIIRAKTRITINGTIDASGIIPNAVPIPFIAGAPGTVGGGGGGGGHGGSGNNGDQLPGKSGYFYNDVGQTGGGVGGAGGVDGTDGTAGTTAVSLDTLVPSLLSFVRVYPGVTTAFFWGGSGGTNGAAGGDGSSGFTGGAAGGAGGAGAGITGGLGGGLILLIAPEIVFGPLSALLSNGTNGVPGNPGFAGGSSAVLNDDGGGGGGGQSGSGGGTGGPILVYFASLLDAGVTTSVLGGLGGAAGAGGLGGSGGGGTGDDGGDGGDGSVGPAGALGIVVMSQIIPP